MPKFKRVKNGYNRLDTEDMSENRLLQLRESLKRENDGTMFRDEETNDRIMTRLNVNSELKRRKII